MKVDSTLVGQPGDWDVAVLAEQNGYDCAWLPEWPGTGFVVGPASGVRHLGHNHPWDGFKGARRYLLGTGKG